VAVDLDERRTRCRSASADLAPGRQRRRCRADRWRPTRPRAAGRSSRVGEELSHQRHGHSEPVGHASGGPKQGGPGRGANATSLPAPARLWTRSGVSGLRSCRTSGGITGDGLLRGGVGGVVAAVEGEVAQRGKVGPTAINSRSIQFSQEALDDASAHPGRRTAAT
jgi:hypothetical protein